MNNSFKKTIFSLLTFIAVIILLIFLNVYDGQMKNELFELRGEVNTNNNLPNISEIEKKTQIIENKQAEVEKFLFDRNLPVEFIEDVESVAARNNLEVLIDDAEFIEKTDGDPDGDHLRLSASLTGPLNNIKTFVGEVETMGKEISIKNFRIIKTQDETGSYWRADMILIGKTK